MDRESRPLEFPFPIDIASGVPLRCRNLMAAQPIKTWTPQRMLAAVLTGLFATSRSGMLALALMKRTGRA